MQATGVGFLTIAPNSVVLVALICVHTIAVLSMMSHGSVEALKMSSWVLATALVVCMGNLAPTT